MENEQKPKEEMEPQTAPEPKATPKEIELAGKKFDISTPEGLLQAQTWSEAMSHMVGKQGQELGGLRKFKVSMAPTETQEKVLTEVSRLREDGEHGKADELLLAYTRKTQSESRNELRQEREKDKFLKSYLKERKDILSTYDEEDFRTLTESKFDFTSEVSFEDLDNHWLPKVKDKRSFDAALPVETPETTVQSVPGGRAPAEKTSKVPDVPSMDEVFNEFDPYKIK